MSKIPLFSIVIPTYNRAKLLRKAIQSVLDQKNHDWELIVVDDGSTDNTKEIISLINDRRIHYFYQNNKERSAARNVGIRKSIGQYICFLDDDDYFLPNHLTAFEYRIIQEKYPVGIFRTGMITKEGSKEIYSSFYSSKTSSHPIPFFLKNMVGIHTLCYHREIFKTHFYDERWYHFQDTHLLILCLLEFPFFQIHQHTVVYVRYDGMGSISIFKSANAEDRTENNINAIKDLFKHGGSELLKYVPINFERYMIAAKYLNHANAALYVGKKNLAKIYFKKSLQYSKMRFLFWSYLKFGIHFILSYLK